MKSFSFKIKNTKLAKRLKKTVIWLLCIFSFLGLSIAFIGYFYEDAVKHVIIDELNKSLNTEIIVANVDRDIQFSVFKDFPYASVTFHNVIIMDAIKDKKKKGKLLEAKSVSLQFNIWDIIFGQYEIKKLAIDDATIRVKIYRDRSDNYHIWKPSTGNTKSKFSFALNKVLLNNVSLDYTDFKLQHDFRAFASNVIFKGRFSDAAFTMNIDGYLYVYGIKIKKEVYLANRGTDVDVTLFINNDKDFVEFREGNVDIGKMSFDLRGKVSYADSITYLDLSVASNRMKLQSFINELPPRYKSAFDGYNCKGDFKFSAQIKGYSGTYADPLITASFSLNGGDIIREKTDVALSKVNFSATYTNGNKHCQETAVLNISGFNSILNDGSISGNMMIRNFVKSQVSLKVAADLDLKDVFLFLKMDTVESAAGRIKLNADIKGTLENSSGFSIKDFINSTATGTLDVQNAEIVLKHSKNKFSNLNGAFVFNNNDIESKNFSGNYGSSDFVLKGTFSNILPYIFMDHQNLKIDATLESQKLNIDEFLALSAGKKDTVYTLKMPDNLQFNLALKVHSTSFRKFSATNITGNVSLNHKVFIAKDISLQAVNGRLNFTGLIDGSNPGKLLISCDATINRMNIQQLFTEMGNFGQKSIEDKNLKGVVNATVQFASIWSSQLKVEKPTIYAKANITIENGELNNYEPLNGLSKYLKNRDLSHVSFKTMSNTIEIKNQLISIPQMEINSSAICFNMNGTHGFDQTIDYHLGVQVAQLRSKGADRNDEVADIGQIEDDGLHKEKYFFRITGTVDKPIYHTLDASGIKANIKSDFKHEKESLKVILNREFGWFKKDSAINKNNKDKSKDKYDFNVIWDDDTPDKKE